ncbi:MAG: hypothetical protein JRJ84_16325 [Deltaproteobacteria bacterium]|nr:hypothetical protein [Deltaproteobacteria bacterium]
MSFPIPQGARALLPLALVLAFGLAGCKGDDTDDTDDTGADDTGNITELPPDPTPWSLSLSGGESVDLSFSDGQCWQFDGSGDFRQRWQDDVANWVLTIEVVDEYEGDGVYDQTEGALVTLFHNVAQGSFYQTSAGSHAVTVDMGLDDEEVAAGTVTIAGMTDTNTSWTVTLSPATLPIWCDTVIN